VSPVRSTGAPSEPLGWAPTAFLRLEGLTEPTEVAIEAGRLRPPAVAGGAAEVAGQCGSEEEEATGEETSPVDGMANTCKSGIGQGVEMAAGIRMGAGWVNQIYIYLSMYTNLCKYYPCLPLTPYLYIYIHIYIQLFIYSYVTHRYRCVYQCV